MHKKVIKRQKWKAGNMVYPIPAAMVSCGDQERANIVTVGWVGTVCTNPAMTYISLRPSRYSYDIIKETGYFVINLTTKALARATDYCGVKSGREHDKFKEMNLTVERDEDTQCPMIAESPVSIVCKVTEIKELGSHHMFIGMVSNVYIDEQYLDEKGKFHLNASDLIAYSHGSYLGLGDELGTFGYSVKKESSKKKIKEEKKEDRVPKCNKSIEKKKTCSKKVQSHTTSSKKSKAKKKMNKTKKNSK